MTQDVYMGRKVVDARVADRHWRMRWGRPRQARVQPKRVN